ncbi:MAG: hypothetical protein ACLTSZ_01020 [Lachnospiraceae bacterium]
MRKAISSGLGLAYQEVVSEPPDKLRSSYSVMTYHKKGPLAGRFLVILQVAKRIANIRFDENRR